MSPTRRLPHDHFLNRELSLLAFNRRVLAQAADDRVPLLRLMAQDARAVVARAALGRLDALATGSQSRHTA